MEKKARAPPQSRLEDGLDDPAMLLFRKLMLESNAQNEQSDLFCPTCKTNLPYNQLTLGTKYDGVDANMSPTKVHEYFCTLCQEYF